MPPQVLMQADFTVRCYAGPDDIATWLHVRNRAFAGQIAGTRPWTEEDFRREFLAKPGWRPDWMWFAQALEAVDCERTTTGVVALGVTELAGMPIASVQWLAVLPEWRRRGVGKVLLATLEAAAWEAGHRTITAETLAEWGSAVGFYRAMGYEKREGFAGGI